MKLGWQIITTLILAGTIYLYYRGYIQMQRGFEGEASLFVLRGNTVMLCLIGLCNWVGMFKNGS